MESRTDRRRPGPVKERSTRNGMHRDGLDFVHEMSTHTGTADHDATRCGQRSGTQLRCAGTQKLMTRRFIPIVAALMCLWCAFPCRAEKQAAPDGWRTAAPGDEIDRVFTFNLSSGPERTGGLGI